MTGRTHAVAGVATLWVLHGLPATSTFLAALVPLAALGALLPDLDASRSTIRSLQFGGVTPFSPLARLLSQTLGHRGGHRPKNLRGVCGNSVGFRRSRLAQDPSCPLTTGA
jgi:membrane-bound metal-dependent hydrolase YbcI (DUF457 family)